MTEEVKRGPGRPPKVRPEADVVEAAPEVKVEEPKERLIEVQLVTNYVVSGQESEIKLHTPAGTVISLPAKEASRALKLGIARGTDRTFD